MTHDIRYHGFKSFIGLKFFYSLLLLLLKQYSSRRRSFSYLYFTSEKDHHLADKKQQKVKENAYLQVYLSTITMKAHESHFPLNSLLNRVEQLVERTVEDFRGSKQCSRTRKYQLAISLEYNLKIINRDKLLTWRQQDIGTKLQGKRYSEYYTIFTSLPSNFY